MQVPGLVRDTALTNLTTPHSGESSKLKLQVLLNFKDSSLIKIAVNLPESKVRPGEGRSSLTQPTSDPFPSYVPRPFSSDVRENSARKIDYCGRAALSELLSIETNCSVRLRCCSPTSSTTPNPYSRRFRGGCMLSKCLSGHLVLFLLEVKIVSASACDFCLGE